MYMRAQAVHSNSPFLTLSVPQMNRKIYNTTSTMTTTTFNKVCRVHRSAQFYNIEI